MKIYIWELTEGSVYEDTPASSMLFTTEAEAAEHLRGTLDERRVDLEDNCGATPPAIPADLGAQALIDWAKQQPDYEREAYCWLFHVWDTSKSSNFAVCNSW